MNLLQQVPLLLLRQLLSLSPRFFSRVTYAGYVTTRRVFQRFRFFTRLSFFHETVMCSVHTASAYVSTTDCVHGPGVGPYRAIPRQRGHCHAALNGGGVRREGGVRHGRHPQDAGEAHRRSRRWAQAGGAFYRVRAMVDLVDGGLTQVVLLDFAIRTTRWAQAGGLYFGCV